MMEFLAALVLSVCLIPGVLLRYLPFRSLVNRRQKWILAVTYLILGLVHLLLLTWLMLRRGFAEDLNLLRLCCTAYAVLTVVVNILVIPGRVREHGFVFGIVISCNYLLLYIPTYLVSKMNLPQEMRYFVIDVLYGLLLLLLFVPVRMLLRSTVEPFLYLDDSSYWKTTWIIPLIHYCSLFISFTAEGETASLLQLIARILSVLVVVFICFSIAKDHRYLGQRKILESQLAAQKQHYADLLEQVEKSHQQHHDLKHHMAAIRYYLESNDIQGLSQYISEYGRQHEERVAMPYSGNSAVDAVLYHSMKRAAEMNVKINCAGTIRNCAVGDIDLCALLGNALENALDACRYLESGRVIDVVFQSREFMTSIVVRNTFDGTVYQNGPYLLSRKRRGEQRGVGVASMREICQRCGGSLEYTWDQACFTVLMLLPGIQSD